MQNTSLSEFADFEAACARRETLQLELRDEAGNVFPCDWIRINDIDDHSSLDEDIYDDEPRDPEVEAAIQHDVELFESECERNDSLGTCVPPDARWDTMKYHVMVYLGDRV